MNVQNVLNWLLNNLQLLVVIGIFVLPVLGKMWANVQKARALRAAKARAEQERIEQLRTGRISETARVLEPVRVEQPVRRQQTSRQVSAPGMKTSAGGAGTSGGMRMRQIRLPGGIVIEVPDETPGGSKAESDSRAGQSQKAAQRSKKAKQPSQRTPARVGESQISATNRVARAAASAASEATMVAAYGEAGAVRTATATAAAAREARGAAPRTAIVGLLGPGASRDDIRKAFVMSEVLGKPKGAE
jgi:hypothetical protein